MTGAEILIDCLKKQTVEVVFGIPGSQLCEIYLALEMNRQSIRHITARHEGGASLMAVGYARTTNKPGVCLTIPGPGTSNAYTGILEGYTACDPLLLITVIDTEYTNRDPSKIQHGFDQISAFKPVTKFATKVNKIDDIPRAVNEAFALFSSGRPKPVLLEIGRDVLIAESDSAISTEENNVDKPRASDEQIKHTIKLLYQSQRPFIIAGHGICFSYASGELLEFARLLNAPVATTALSKGTISDKDPLSVGYIKTQTAQEIMADSDLIFAIGTRFTQVDTENWTMKITSPLIHIETDPEEINKEYISEVGITGGPKTVLNQLLVALNSEDQKKNWESRIDKIKKLRATPPKILYLEKIRRTIPENAIFCNDVHWLGYPACRTFEVYAANTFLHSPISMTLGFALPAAIGAKIAQPDKKVIVYCGDGGFLLSSPELATIIKYNLSIVVILINDNSYGTIENIQSDSFKNTIGVKLSNPDFLKFAESFGIRSFRVKGINNVGHTLTKALSLNEPVLIEVIPTRSLKGKIYQAVKKVGKQFKL